MIDYPASITAAREAMQSSRLTPEGLITATLDRIQTLNPKLNAYLEVFPVRDRVVDGPLSGIPIAVKDLFDVAGYRTTAGSSFLCENIAVEDAPVVARLRAAGAMLTGKTNLHEWALGVTNDNPHFGACRNPWDVERIPGGSSGGSAAAVAAGLCLGALGSDTGGSIRIPAALCGIVGLKPTRGRVSLRGVVPLSWSLDHAGPMARCVRDVALMLQVIAGHDPLDPVSVNAPVPDYQVGLADASNLTGVRVGLPRSFFFDDLDGEVCQAVDAAIGVWRDLGAQIVAVDLREAGETSGMVRVMLLSDAAAYHRERIESHAESFGADVLSRLRAGRELSAMDYALARHAQRRWQMRLRELFSEVDVLVTPATAIPAVRIGELDGASMAGRLTRFTNLFNFAGTPAISVPCGFTSGGLPIGMQIVGKWWDEIGVLRAAHAYEQATGWWLRKALP